MVSFTCNVWIEHAWEHAWPIYKHTPFVEIPGKLHKLTKQQNKLPNNNNPKKPNPFYTSSSGVLLHWISISYYLYHSGIFLLNIYLFIYSFISLGQ
jgi:hypothetical protein